MRVFLGAARLMAWVACLFAFLDSAEAQHVRSAEDSIAAAFEAEQLHHLHAALVIFKGETLVELYFKGVDERLGRPLGMVDHGPETLHDIRSITKSVVALLYGIALAEGAVPAPQALLLPQFPEYQDLAGDPSRDRITIGDALAMKMGTKWDEEVAYFAPGNSQYAMDASLDPARFALEREMVSIPGERWSYNGGATTLIAKLIEDGTGVPLDDYARQKLFEPLGISRWEWGRRPDGVPSAASGLRMTARDLAKLGQLVLDGGLFGGSQIVPRPWLDEVFIPRSHLGGIRYGYFWWLADSEDPRAWISGLGNELPRHGDWPAWVGGLGSGGQRLSVQPDIGLIVVILAGDYEDPDDWMMPVRIIEEHIAPELQGRLGK